MSRHKLVKNLDLNEELDDYDGNVEGEFEEDLTDQDRENLRRGLLAVRSILDTQISASDKEIEDSLYYYYYDVDKTVNYLLSQETKGTTQKSKKSVKESGKGSTGPSPDDVVIKAQTSKGIKNAKPTQAKPDKGEDTDTTSLTRGVSEVSIPEKSKVKSKNINVAEEFGKSKPKNAASFVVIGHVDAGKSTLMGRMLHDLNVVDQRTMDKYQRESSKIGKSSFAYAWVMDEGTEERARGVTIDIATNQFSTSSTLFTILDAPGHRDFIPNMIAGAAQADFALLVIDSDTGNFESGLKGQTKEHVLLVRSTGVQRIVVAVNKLDAVGWSHDRFTDIQQQLSAFLTSTGFHAKNVTFIPCSGLTGENVVTSIAKPESSWYTGSTLLEALEPASTFSRALDKPLRMTIEDVFRGGVQSPLSIIGRIDQGTLQIGDPILVLPSSAQQPITIKSITIADTTGDNPAEWAVAGQIPTLHLTDLPTDPKASPIRPGDVICHLSSPIPCVTSFRMKLLAFEHVMPMQVEILKGRLNAPGKVAELVTLLDKTTGASTTTASAAADKLATGSTASGKKKKAKKPRLVKPGEVARVVVEVEEAIPLETGARVVLRAAGSTIGAGLVE